MRLTEIVWPRLAVGAPPPVAYDLGAFSASRKATAKLLLAKQPRAREWPPRASSTLSFADRLRAAYAKAFREREVFLRSQGSVRFRRLTSRVQFAMFLVATAVFLWTAWASTMAWWQVRVIQAKEQQITAGRVAYSDLHKELTTYRKRFADASETIRRMTSLHSAQERLLERLSGQADHGIEDAERVITMAGLGLSRFVEGGDGAEQRPESPDLQEIASQAATLGVSHSVVSLAEKMERLEMLRTALRSIPLVPPVDSYRVTSGFGLRRDPFSGQWTSHYGVDLAGPLNSGIWAAAPGTVTFAGINGSLGRMVEIDHGFGITTRYGHLGEADVQQGQVIQHRQKIGLMGSTGESTGPHVHYEILFDGKQTDPIKFLRAGRYVFKG